MKCQVQDQRHGMMSNGSVSRRDAAADARWRVAQLFVVVTCRRCFVDGNLTPLGLKMPLVVKSRNVTENHLGVELKGLTSTAGTV